MNLKFREWNLWQQLTTGALGALVIGALGSGLWEKLGDPTYTFIRDALLNIATLGVTAYKDNTYEQVSKGFHERPSVMMLSLSLTLLVMFLGYATGRATPFRRGRAEKAAERISYVAQKGVYVFLFVSLASVVSVILQSAQLKFVNDASPTTRY